jgi:hypothetical protein
MEAAGEKLEVLDKDYGWRNINQCVADPDSESEG